MAVAYQVNPAHDGNMQAAAPVGPLAQKWSVDLGDTVSYPLIARGKVFATVSNPTGYGTTLHALNATDGTEAWTPVDLGGTYWWSGIAYDDGRLFAVNFDGVVRAFDAGTGQQLWRRDLTLQYAFTSPPTAQQGVLYLGGAGTGGTLFALDAATGADRWVQDVANGDHSSPALSQDGVFVSYSCPNVFKFDRWTGNPGWHTVTGCSGGGGRTPVYYDGKLYARDTVSSPAGYVYGEYSNTVLGRFDAGPAPAFANGLGYFVHGGTLTARNTSTGAQAWTYPGTGLSTAPIVAGSNLYVASSSGTLHVVDATTGQQLWTAPLPAGVAPPDEHNVSKPLTGLNAGEGLLVVPAENHLVAFGSATP